MAEDEDLPKGICQNFVPQQWRKTKCKLCFEDIIEHTKSLTKEESEEYIKNCMKEDDENDDGFTEDGGRLDDEGHHDLGLGRRRQGRERPILASTSTIVGDTEHCYSSQSNYTHGSSKGSSEQLNVEDSNMLLDVKDSDNDDETADEGNVQTPITRRRRKKFGIPLTRKHSPSFTFDHLDSHDADDGSVTPRMSQKRRTRSYRKNSSNLLQLSAMVRSSNSSLCSYTSELTDGYSDYDYDVRSITDDTDDYAEIPDVIEELELIKPELKIRVENERRVSRSKISNLERELEGQQDYYRASEVAKDRQIKSLFRDIEGLKLELSSVKAHENILALKSRLEQEGKNSRILDLEQEVNTLQVELVDLSKAPHNIEVQHDFLHKELTRASKRINQLEEENRSTEERMKLAEDLKHNDKELIDLLRDQLGSLEIDLTNEQERNSLLEDKLKLMDMIRADFLKEQEKTVKSTKEGEAMRQKIKRRDRHIEDLEDDNVKLQQLKHELESQIAKKEFKVKKMERKISELQNEVTKCNKEIADLTGENKTLEQVRRLTDLQLKDMSTEQTSEVANGERLFIHTLEDRLKHRESRLKELELENDNFLKEIKELYESLKVIEQQYEEANGQVKEQESKINKMRQENKHNEKKIDMFHRKLQKSEKEKRRAVNKQNNAELKLSQFQEQECVRTEVEALHNNTNYDSSDDSDSRILKLKLQSTEARLSMIEVNKGYLESKVLNLEKKLVDKEEEIMRLNDSMERDSGAPSQDYDRFDALERENIMLQTKLDEIVLENDDQKEVVNRLKENNQNLEKTIQNLNYKLDSCTIRLKEVEEANHKLGREALKRNQSLNSVQGEVQSSLNELREHNQILQKKVNNMDDIEELVERLEQQVKTEKSHVQWYFDENEKLTIQTAKMADTIRKLERSKFEFEQSVRQLSETNKDLNNDVKRLEQKLEIYGELFDKDSHFHSSLKRRSYQGDHREQDDEKLIENALAPLIGEIKEKDSQIRSLQKAVEEREQSIKSLNKEIDLLETNLAAMVTEKIRNMNVSSDAEKIRNSTFNNSNNDLSTTKLFSTDSSSSSNVKLRSRSDGDVTKHIKKILPVNVIKDDKEIRIGRPYTLVLSASEIDSNSSNVIIPRRTTPESEEPRTPTQETYLALTSIPSPVNKSPPKDKNIYSFKDIDIGNNLHDSIVSIETEINSNQTSPSSISPKSDFVSAPTDIQTPSTKVEDILSVTTETFYQIIQDHEQTLKKRDEQYYKALFSETSDPSTNIYDTIESAILDQYRDDGRSNLSSTIPSLSGTSRLRVGDSVSLSIVDSKLKMAAELGHMGEHHEHVDKHVKDYNDVDSKSISNIAENKAMVEDMYDQLALLEDLVTVKYPANTSTKKTLQRHENVKEQKIDVVESSVFHSNSSSEQEHNSDGGVPVKDEVPLYIPRIGERQSSRESSLGLPSNTTLLCRTPSTSSSHSQDSNSIDLSGLDDLLAEVDRRGSGSHDIYSAVVQETKRRTSSVSVLEHRAAITKTMPSIRTTKRRIIKLGGLNRSGSFDSATKRKTYVASTATIASHSSSSLTRDPRVTAIETAAISTGYHSNNTSNNSINVNGASSSSSITSSTSSMASVVYVPSKENLPSSEYISSSTTPTTSSKSVAGISPPYRRPKLDANKFLGSSADSKF